MNKLLIIPGLFTNPSSQKAKAISEAMQGYESVVVDYTPAYHQMLTMNKMTEIVQFYLNEHKPDAIVTFL